MEVNIPANVKNTQLMTSDFNNNWWQKIFPNSQKPSLIDSWSFLAIHITQAAKRRLRSGMGLAPLIMTLIVENLAHANTSSPPCLPEAYFLISDSEIWPLACLNSTCDSPTRLQSELFWHLRVIKSPSGPKTTVASLKSAYWSNEVK